MKLTERKVDSSLIVKFDEARLDAHNAASFKSSIADLVERGESRIILDLSGIEFIDSSGLGAIVSSLKSLGAGGKLCIFGLQDATKSMFKLTRMDRVIPLFDEETQAVAGQAA